MCHGISVCVFEPSLCYIYIHTLSLDVYRAFILNVDLNRALPCVRLCGDALR